MLENLGNIAGLDWAQPAPDILFDPRRPVLPLAGSPAANRVREKSARSQRQRRASILAAVRRLLIEEGYKGVQLRRIAELSGVVVQTVHNLVGPRDIAIVEAIADYTAHTARLAPFTPEGPAALIKLIAWQGQSVMRVPEFARQVCLLYLSEGRHIFQEYRARQIKHIHLLLARQKRLGMLRRDANCRALAEEMLFLSSALFVEWADVAFPTEELIARIAAGQTHILASAIDPRMDFFAGTSI